jgi:ParB/RepB/Spo0J family partition protein
MNEINVVKIGMKLIDRPKDPARSKIDAEKVRELAESIREVGLQQPVLLRPLNGRYEVVAGDRRFLAHKFLGLEEIASIVRELTEEETIIIRATENLQREDLTPMDEARVYGSMRSGLGMSIEKIARKMGRTYVTIKKYLELLELDPEFQEAIDSKKIGIEVAHILSQIDDPEFKKFYFTSAVENGVTKEVAVSWLAAYRQSKEARYYAEGGAGGGSSAITEDKPIYQTCGGCNGPVEIKEIRYVPLCPGCIKEILRRWLKMYRAFMKPNPGIGFTWIITILVQIFSTIMPIITPTLKKEMEDFLLGLYAKAKESPNPWDDFLLKFLLRMLNIPIPGEWFLGLKAGDVWKKSFFFRRWMMAIDVKQFELDRMINMMRSFGWTVVKSEFQDQRIIVQMEKVVKPEVPKAWLKTPDKGFL